MLMAYCRQHHACTCMCVDVCSPLLCHFCLKELTVGVTLIFPRKEGAEQDRLVIYSSCEFKLAGEEGMACRKFQEVSQVCSSPKGEWQSLPQPFMLAGSGAYLFLDYFF